QLGLDLVAAALTARRRDDEPPPELRAAYEPERWRRAREYGRARARFGMVVETVTFAVTLAFWLGGGFGALGRAVRALGVGPIVTGLLFVAAIGVGRALVGLPFRWWSTFVLEARFGFNRTTPWTFWTDLAKGLLLAAVLGGPLLVAILWL